MKTFPVNEAMIREFKRLADMILAQNGIRLNLDRAVKDQDVEKLRVWEKTFRAPQEMK
jgi:hypothetical protein